MRILVIEDDARLSSVLKRGLTEEGYLVDVAADGDSGLAAAALDAYDAVVLDLLLPGQDGLTVCRTLRRQAVPVPILVLTALGAVDERIAGLDAGADDYLVKPFAFGELSARLRALLRRESVNRSMQLCAGAMCLDQHTGMVTLAGEQVEVTAKEYRLLEYFLTHPGIALTRAQLEERVWRNEFEINSNVVDVYVRRLRRKLDPTGAYIQTVRGLGYRLRRDGEQAHGDS